MGLQSYLMGKLKNLDCLAWSNNATGFGMRGIPDVTIITHKKIFYVEVKDEKTKDRLCKLQKYRIEQIENYGHEVNIVRNKEDIDFLIKDLKNFIESVKMKNIK